MNRTLRALTLALAALLLPSCITVSTDGGEDRPEPQETRSPTDSGDPSNVRGSGNVVIEERPVSGFDRISLSGAADMFVEQAGEESLSVEAEDNLLPLLTSEVSGGRLVLGVRPNSSISATRPIVFRVRVRSLKGIEASGSGIVDVAGLDVPELDVNISGAMNSVFGGKAALQRVEVSGTGRFDGSDLAGERGELRVSGTADAEVNVSRELDVEVNGTALVRYAGDPTVTSRVSGLGRVEKL